MINNPKQIKITISGDVNAGKSIIAYCILKSLKESSINVDFKPNADFSSMNHFTTQSERMIEKGVLNYLKSDDVNITLYDKNTRRFDDNHLRQLCMKYAESVDLYTEEEQDKAFTNIKNYFNNISQG